MSPSAAIEPDDVRIDPSVLIALIDETPVGILLEDIDVSARLRRILGIGYLRDMPLKQYVRKRASVEAWMLRQPNCGRRSVHELNQLLARHVRKQLEEAGISSSEQVTTKLLSVSGAHQAPLVPMPPTEWTVETFVDWAIGLLDERQQDIVRRRFGLGIGEETLEEIGQTYGVTRERIRQLEAKALGELARVAKKHALAQAVDARRPEVWDSLREGADYLTSKLFERRKDRIAARLTLAIQIVGNDVPRWIGRYAHRLGRGWIDPSLEAGALKVLARELRSYVRQHPLPRSLLDMEDGVSSAGVGATAELLLGWSVEGGYVFQKTPSARGRRATRIHALLVNIGAPVDVLDLLQIYHARAPTDRCSDRDLLVVMEAAKHLFIEIWEGRWAAVGPAPRMEVDIAERCALPPVSPSGPATITYALENLLKRTGPLRVSELVEKARSLIPDGRSVHSIGPILLLNPGRFVRLLPGVYALRAEQPSEEDVREASLPYLLNEQQARLFARARRTGEAWFAFPLWSPTAEMRLCRWARNGVEPEVFRSLLAVATPSAWPCDASGREEWTELKRRYGRYEIERVRPKRSVRPSLDRLFAVALELNARGSIGALSINRSLGVRVDSSSAVGVLDALQDAGMAEPTDPEGGYELPYTTGPRLSFWLDRLSAELHDHGSLNWDRGYGLDLAKSIRCPTDDEWAGTACQPSDDVDEFDDFVLEHRRFVTRQKLEDALNALDEDD